MGRTPAVSLDAPNSRKLGAKPVLIRRMQGIKHGLQNIGMGSGKDDS